MGWKSQKLTEPRAPLQEWTVIRDHVAKKGQGPGGPRLVL